MLAADYLSLKNAVRVYDTRDSLRLLEDPRGELDYNTVSTLPDSAFRPLGDSDFSGGYSDSVYWLKLTLLYELSDAQKDLRHDWILEITYSPLDYVDVYYAPHAADTPFLSGDMRPQSAKRTPGSNHAFYVTPEPNEELDVYVRVQTSSSLQLPMMIWSPGGLYEARSLTRLGYGLYFGVLIVMALYNLMLFVMLGEKSYIYYVIYVGSFALLQAAIAGLASQYLWPELPSWGNRSIPFLMAMSCFFGVVFARSFLGTRNHSPNTDKLLLAIAILSAVITGASLFVTYALALTAGNILTFLLALAVIWAATLATIKRLPGALFFLLGWAALLSGATIFMLVSTGVLPANWFTSNAAMYGSATEALLLAMALGAKISALRSARKDAARQAREDLQAINVELSSSLAELRQGDALKDKFLIKVSHELRTPLNGIIGSLELLKYDTSEDEATEYRESASLSADHMLRLVNTLLEFSEAKHAHISDQQDLRVDLHEIQRSLLKKFAPSLRERYLSIDFSFEADMPMVLIGDERKLCMVLIRLLEHAVERSERGIINVNVRALSLSLDHCLIEFDVCDCGKPISAAELDDLFDPLGTTVAAAELKTNLALCKQLLERMNGQISAKSLERGTAIRFHVPLSLPPIESH